MRLRLPICLLLLLAASGAAAQGALPAALLDAPLAILGQSDSETLRDQLAQGAPLVLVLWNTDCADCLQNLAETGALAVATPGLRVLGVTNDADPWAALDAAEERRLPFLSLHDPGARFAAALGCEGTSYAFAILDSEGRVLALAIDKQPDAAAAIRQALASLPAAPPTAREAMAGTPAASPAAFPQLTSSGTLRLAALAVGLDDALADGPCAGEPGLCACALGGAYGEALTPLADLLFRLRYDLVLQLSPALRAGAYLRLSNEPARLLAQGPEYLTSERGSAYAEVAAGTWAARLGFNELHFSPLTLQRWDFADNPPVAGTGGAGGCGACGGASHSLSLESLDALGPDLLLEGLRLRGAPRAWLRAELLVARPQRAQAFDASAEPPIAYREDLLGAQLAWLPSLGRGERGELRALYVAAKEDGGSADWPLYAGDERSFVHHGEVYGLLAAAPLPGGLALEQELTRSSTRVDRVDARGIGAEDWAYRGELRATLPGALALSGAWLRLGPDYAAEYHALSYLPNTEGWRLTAKLLRPRWQLALFHKQLARCTRPAIGQSLAESRSEAALLSLTPRADSRLELGGSWTRERFEGDALAGECRCARDCDKLVLTLGAHRSLAPRTSLSLEGSRIAVDGGPAGGEGTALIGRLFFTAGF